MKAAQHKHTLRVYTGVRAQQDKAAFPVFGQINHASAGEVGFLDPSAVHGLSALPLKGLL
jgi:hypothetical protein